MKCVKAQNANWSLAVLLAAIWALFPGPALMADNVIWTMVLTNVQDVTIVGVAGGGTGNPQGSAFILREYWQSNTSYDIRGFAKVSLSAIPSGAVLTAATFGVWYENAWGGANTNSLDMGYTIDEFDVARLTYETYDGVNVWTDGMDAGVDGCSRVHPHSLGGVQVDPTMPMRYVAISTPALVQYLQMQIKVRKDAWFEFALNDANGGFQYFLSAEYPDSTKRPYLQVSYTLPAGGTVQGQANLQDYRGDRSLIPVTVEVRDNSTTARTSVVLSDDGWLTLAGFPAGTHDLWVKPDHWLAKFLRSVVVANSGSLGTIDFVNGDADNDNAVGVADLAVIHSGMDTTSGSAGWSPIADMDGDNEVTGTDLAIVLTNMELVGE